MFELFLHTLYFEKEAVTVQVFLIQGDIGLYIINGLKVADKLMYIDNYDTYNYPIFDETFEQLKKTNNQNSVKVLKNSKLTNMKTLL